MNKFNPEYLKNFASKHNLALKFDPFHASYAFEFQHQYESEKLLCVGAIFGPELVEIYRRHTDLSTESKKEWFWFLSWLRPTAKVLNDYVTVASMTEEAFCHCWEELLIAELCLVQSPICDIPPVE